MPSRYGSSVGSTRPCILPIARSPTSNRQRLLAMARTLNWAARLGLVRSNPGAVATCSQALADIVSRYDLPAFWTGGAAFCQGWTRWWCGKGEAGLAEMRRASAFLGSNAIFRTWSLSKPHLGHRPENTAPSLIGGAAITSKEGASQPSDALFRAALGARGRDQENPREHYLPDRRSDEGS
jgi:hypothetical protein